MDSRVRTGLLVFGILAHTTMASAAAGVLVNRYVLTDSPAPQATASPPPPPTCRVSFVRRDEWAGGFTAQVVVTNLGAPIDSWELRYQSIAVRLAQGWNGLWTQQGDQVSVRNLATNGSLESGGSVTVGISATSSGTAPPPTRFVLNDVPCDVNLS